MIFQAIFNRNCKLYFRLCFLCGSINCDIFQTQSRMHSDCQISNGKAKLICNYISHVLRVMSLSYLKSKIYYHVWFFTSLCHTCSHQNSDGIAIPLALEFPMPYTETCQSVSGAGLYYGVFVLGSDITHG